MSENINNNPDNKKLSFENGSLVRYNHPGYAMQKVYGLRSFAAKLEETQPVNDAPKITPANDKTIGIVVGNHFTALHGAGTQYYKILFTDKFFWIAQEHLEKA